MGVPAFFATRALESRTPSGARSQARDNGYATLADTVQGVAWVDSDRVLRFPEDAVLLMIGKTDELVKALAQAAGIDAIGSDGELGLGIFYVRYKVSPVQTDTLVAIGAAGDYWSRGQTDPPPPWRELEPGTRIRGIMMGDLKEIIERHRGEEAWV